MYDTKHGLKTSALIMGLIASLLLMLFTKIGVFDPVYPQFKQLTEGFQLQNSGFFQKIAADWDFFANLGHYKEENQALTEENVRLSTEIAKLKLELIDYQVISTQAGFNQEYTQEPVRVMRYADNQTEIYINKGKDRGIKSNDVAVLGDNLIGTVVESFDNYSVVRLITDKRSKVPGLVVETGSKGIAVGESINTVSVSELPNDKVIVSGNMVVAAGTDGVVPYGLVLGKVESVHTDPTQINQSVTIRSLLKFNNLSNIFILIK